MDVTSLEVRIRMKAETELRLEIDNAMRPVTHLIANASWPVIEVSKTRIKAHEALDEITKALMDALLPSREDRAIKTFLEQVESLQSQIDELKEQVPGQ